MNDTDKIASNRMIGENRLARNAKKRRQRGEARKGESRVAALTPSPRRLAQIPNCPCYRPRGLINPASAWSNS